MIYFSEYLSPLGKILIASNDNALIGLWFEGQKYYGSILDGEIIEKETEIIKETKKWLDTYFSGKVPNFTPHLEFIGTDFQKEVWELLLTIPYGKTEKYGTIAAILAEKHGISRMSSRAVGSAVAHNNISIIVPCHRVVGANNKLTGYAAGIDKKRWLLEHESSDNKIHT